MQRVPVGWDGPVVVATAADEESLPTCADPYPASEPTLFEGYVAPEEMSCACGCTIDTAGCINALFHL